MVAPLRSRLAARAGRVAALAVLLLAPRGAAAASPTDELRGVERQVAALIAGQHGPAALRAKLKPIVDRWLDFDSLGQRSLQVHWPALGAEQRAEYLAVLRELIEAAYLSRIERAPAFSVEYLEERLSGGEATVVTRLSSQGQSVKVAFALEQRDGRWRAYDLVIDDVSLIANYRAQFNKILKTKTFAQLIERMQKKRDQLRDPARPPPPAAARRSRDAAAPAP